MPQRGAAPATSALKPPPVGRGDTDFDPFKEGATAVTDSNAFDPFKEGAIAITDGGNKRSIAGTPELDAIRAAQARKYPSAQERGPKKGLMYAGAKGVVEGLGGQVDESSPIIGTIGNTLGNLYETGKAIVKLPFTHPGARFSEAMSTPEGRRDVLNKTEDIVAGLVHMPSELIQGLMEGDPERVVYGLTGTGAQIGSLFLGSKGVNEAGKVIEGIGAEGRISARMASAASNMIESGVDGAMVNDYARATIPVWRQGAAELGISQADFPKSGVANVSKEAVIDAGKKAIAIADHTADRMASRPFYDALDKAGDASTHPPGINYQDSVKGKIVANLRAQAESEKINEPLAKALNTVATLVEKNGNTFWDLQDLKALANKKASSIMTNSIDATAEAAYAWRSLGDSIRAEMYPALQKMTGINLGDAGRLQAVLMDARDGIYQHYYKDVLNPHNARIAQKYLEYVNQGSQRNRSLFKRAMLLEGTPAGTFNRRFGEIIGTQEMPQSVPYHPGARYNFAPPTLEGKPQVINELFPSGNPETEPLLAPPPGTSRGIAEALYKIQQRVRREGEAAPPSTLRGTQSELMRTTPIISEPGVSQPKGATLESQYQTKLSRQAATKAGEKKLFPPEKPGTQYSLERGMAPSVMGLEQTPHRFVMAERATYMMKDLREMMDEISNFLKRNPSHPQAVSLRGDYEAIKHELDRRIQAHKQ